MSLSKNTEKNDFSKGNVYRHIIRLAIPGIIAMMVQMMYSMVDRIYIGHLPGTSSIALTGLGLTFPVVTLISAFTNLFGMGAAPLFSIERGKQNHEKAQKIVGNTFTMLIITLLLLMFLFYIFMKPVLYLFGASDESYIYASMYLQVYLLGMPFDMLGTGMNGLINSQGFAKTAMGGTLIGAVLNIILDPIFIFKFNLGIRGAAYATIISQFIGFIWVMRFHLGKDTRYPLKKEYLKPEFPLVKEITSLGLAGFVMSASNGLVQIACNATLRDFGGDIYVGIMTVLNSVRDVLTLTVSGLTHGAQPVLGYNYGARCYNRIWDSIKFLTVVCLVYLVATWGILQLFPGEIMSIFNNDPELISKGIPALHIYFGGFVFMGFQFIGQSTFTGLGYSRHAVFFSIFRKVIIVVPLTYILPRLFGLGVKGVYIAEPISNLIGGAASYTTMIFTIRRLMKDKV